MTLFILGDTGDECGQDLLTWNVHTPECDRLQPVSSKGVARVEKSLNRAAKVPAPGIDFAIGFPDEVVGKLQWFVGDFGTIADTFGISTYGQKTLFEDFNRGLETLGVLKRSLLQEG